MPLVFHLGTPSPGLCCTAQLSGRLNAAPRRAVEIFNEKTEDGKKHKIRKMRLFALETALLLFLCVFPRNAQSQINDIISTVPTGGILRGIGNVASSATNFLYTAVEKPRNLLVNASRITTGVIDSAAARGLEFKLRRFLEKFRTRMQYGIPEFGIPVLEPFHLDELQIEIDNEEIGNISLIIKDLLVRNLSTYVIDRAKLSLMGPTITGNLTIPRLTAEGDYSIFGTLGETLPLSGAGPFRTTIYDFRLYVHATLGYSRGMYLKSFELDFSLGSMDMHLENLMTGSGEDENENENSEDDDGTIGRVMSQVFQELTPKVLEVVKPDVLPAIQEYVAQRVNDTIKHLTMRDIFHVLIGHNEFRDYEHRLHFPLSRFYR